MKILALTTWYPYPDKPNFGAFVPAHAHALRLQGADVKMLAVLNIYDANALIPKVSTDTFEDSHGTVTLRIIVASRYQKALYRLPMGLMPYINRSLGHFLGQNWRPDLIHAHVGFPTGYLALLLAKKLDSPYIITEHFSGAASFLQKDALLGLATKAYQKAAAIIFVSQHLKDEVLATNTLLKTTPTAVIGNVVDGNCFKYKAEDENQNNTLPSTPIVVSIFNLARPKLPDIIAEALGKISSKQPLVWVLIGSGHLLDTVLEIVQQYPTLNLLYFPFLDKTQIAQKLQSATLLVHASFTETFGVVAREALCCGTPLVASDIPAMRAIINAENIGSLPMNGLLSLNTVDGFTQTITLALSTTYNRKAIADYASNHDTAEAIGRQLMDVFTGVLAERVTT